MVLAENGYFIYGYDIDKIEKKINNKKMPFYEKGMQDLLDAQVGKNLKIVENIKDFEADIFIITVGTPFDLKEENQIYLTLRSR